MFKDKNTQDLWFLSAALQSVKHQSTNVCDQQQFFVCLTRKEDNIVFPMFCPMQCDFHTQK